MKKNKIIDVIIILIIIAISIFARSLSFTLRNVDDESKDYYKDSEGIPYLYDLDSYYYARKTNEIIDSHDYSLIIDKNDDKLMNSIKSGEENKTPNLFPVLCAFIYKFISLFTNISFNMFIACISPILYSLCIIPVYIFVKNKTNRFGAITSSFLAGFSASFFFNTSAMCFDTDTLLLMFPVIYICSYIKIFESNTLKSKIMYTILSLLGFLALILTWSAYSVYYYLTLAIFIILLIVKLIQNKFNIKDTINSDVIRWSFICVILYTLCCLIVYHKLDISIISSVFNIFIGKFNFSIDAYPDPGKFVSELAKMPLFANTFLKTIIVNDYSIVNRLGGLFVVIALLLTMIYFGKTLYVSFKNKDDSNIYMLVLIIWTLGGLVSIIGGSRFIKIASIPTSLMVGIGIGLLSKNRLIYKSDYVFIICLMLIILSPLCAVASFSLFQIPSVDDSITETSIWLKENTNEDDVIVSWWDLGYYYEYIGQRKAIGDGGSFDGRYYYWLSNILMTDDIDLAYGISRMLSISGTDASILIDEYFNDSKKGSEVLKSILILNEEDAKDILENEYNLSDKKINKLLNLTHKDIDYDIYIIITKDMLSKTSAYKYYANWNFGDEDIKRVSKNSLIYRLFNHDDVYDGKLEYVYSNNDELKMYSSKIFKINVDKF